MFVGSYASAEDPGMYVYSYDEEDLRLTEIQQISGYSNPGFLAVHPEGTFLYAVNEIADFGENKEGLVTSFRIDEVTGELQYLNMQSSEGANPCHISILGESHVLVANYTGGNIAALPVDSDGSLREASSVAQHEGSGPNERRQSAPHAHSVYPSVDGSYIFAADLGIDRVLIYRMSSSGEVMPNTASPHAVMEPGAGPRHLAFHPGGRWIYVINELNSTVTRVDFEKDSGQASVKESVTTLPPDWDGNNSCADIHVHPSGRFLYASNRGHNSIAIFRIESDGRVTPSGHEPVRGEWPRNFSIDPQGERLFVANQHSGNITVFDIDQDTGELTFTGKELSIDQPVCIKFLVR